MLRRGKLRLLRAKGADSGGCLLFTENRRASGPLKIQTVLVISTFVVTRLCCQHFADGQNARLARRLLLFPKKSRFAAIFGSPVYCPSGEILRGCVSVDNIYNKEKRGRRLLFFAGRACAAKAEAGAAQRQAQGKTQSRIFLSSRRSGCGKKAENGRKTRLFSARNFAAHIDKSPLLWYTFFTKTFGRSGKLYEKITAYTGLFSDAAASGCGTAKGASPPFGEDFCAAGPDAARTRWKSWANSFLASKDALRQAAPTMSAERACACIARLPHDGAESSGDHARFDPARRPSFRRSSNACQELDA